MRRRRAIIGLGAVVAGAGAAIGSGAFTAVEAERTVSIDVVEDSAALVGIEVNDRYGGETEEGVAEFDLQENVFEDTGFNPDAKTILYAGLSITNNSGASGDTLSVEFSYDSDDVTVPDGQAVPDENLDGQFYLRAFDSDDPPSGELFEGLTFDGDASDVADPSAIPTGETAIFDLVVDPDGELATDEDYSVDVTISATLEAG